jgi:hypothetical protein
MFAKIREQYIHIRTEYTVLKVRASTVEHIIYYPYHHRTPTKDLVLVTLFSIVSLYEEWEVVIASGEM